MKKLHHNAGQGNGNAKFGSKEIKLILQKEVVEVSRWKYSAIRLADVLDVSRQAITRFRAGKTYKQEKR